MKHWCWRAGAIRADHGIRGYGEIDLETLLLALRQLSSAYAPGTDSLLAQRQMHHPALNWILRGPIISIPLQVLDLRRANDCRRG